MWKGYLLQMQPYPWWTPYLEPPVSVRFEPPPAYFTQMRHDEKWWDVMTCFFFMAFSFRINKKWQNKNVKRIPPPNAAIPLVNPILRTSLSCQIWDPHLIVKHKSDMKENDAWWVVFCSWSFDIRQKKMTEQKCTKKRISPPNAAIPLVNPILRTSRFCQIWASTCLLHSDETWWKMMRRYDLFFFMAFSFRINKKWQNKNVKRISPPNAAIPLVNPILRTSRFCQIWASTCLLHSDETWWKMMRRYDLFFFMAFSFRINKKWQNKNVKRIPPPNAAIPLVNPILRTSLVCQIWDLHLIIYSTWFKRNMMKYDEL